MAGAGYLFCACRIVRHGRDNRRDVWGATDYCYYRYYYLINNCVRILYRYSRAKEADSGRVRLPRKSIWEKGVTALFAKFVRSLALARQKYLTNFALRFPRNLADGIPHRSAVFCTPRGVVTRVKGQVVVVVTTSAWLLPENCNLPRREGMRLSVDGFVTSRRRFAQHYSRDSQTHLQVCRYQVKDRKNSFTLS